MALSIPLNFISQARWSTVAVGGFTLATMVAATYAIAQPQVRAHTATTTSELNLVAANRSVGQSRTSITIQGNKRVITTNALPGHNVGQFPNAGNPNSIEAKSLTLSVPLSPQYTGNPTRAGRINFGVALNGVKFDPGAAEFWQGDRRSGWDYNALGGAISLGLDANYAHVQPDGSYHYHGTPTGLYSMLGVSNNVASPIIGWAADGFPIYAKTIANYQGGLHTVRSSFQLKSGARPGGSQPDGRYDGTFVNDFQYIARSGDLDQCNGGFVRTADFPDGTYAYFITDEFPVVPRCLMGTPDKSFTKSDMGFGGPGGGPSGGPGGGPSGGPGGGQGQQMQGGQQRSGSSFGRPPPPPRSRQ